MKPEDCRHRVHKSQSVVLVLSLHSKYTISNYLNKPANATENLVTLKWQFFFFGCNRIERYRIALLLGILIAIVNYMKYSQLILNYYGMGFVSAHEHHHT